MSTWEEWDAAVVSGHIRYLYKLTFVGRTVDTVIPYCTGRETVPFEGVDYLAYPCVHESITIDEVGASTSLKIPATKLWIETCLKHSPKVTLEIFRWREELETAQSIFFGNLENTTFADTNVVMEFGTPLAASNVMLITYYTQRYCNHNMYGQYCSLKFGNLKLIVPSGEFVVTGPRHLMLPGHSLSADYWKNALVFYTVKVSDGVHMFLIEQSNMVRNIEANTLIMKYPLSGYLDLDQELSLAPNCLLDPTRCANLFSNASMCVAWPDMPRSNYTMIDVTQIGEGNQGDIGRPR